MGMGSNNAHQFTGSCPSFDPDKTAADDSWAMIVILPSGRSLGPGGIALAFGLGLMPTALTTSPPAQCNPS